MTHTSRFATMLVLLAGVAAAQSVTDSFTYPDGTTIPGWTEKRGDWIVSNGRVHTTTASTWSYLTKDGLLYKDSVQEALCYYEGTASVLQFAGTCARHNGGNLDNNLLMTKVQDNTSGGTIVGFDALWVYERGTGGGATSQTGIAPFLSARVRNVVVDNQETTWVDWNLDGVWDTNRTRLVASQLGIGDTGVNGFFSTPLTRSSGVDDFALYDGVVTATGTANPGGTLTMNLRGQTAGLTYQAACSLSNSPGIPVDSRRIPLTPDSLMIASFVFPTVFANFAGVLDGTASAQAQINFPPDPALVGFSFFAGFVTIDPAAPSGIANISNDLPITIVP
jgi:hypothetical protein